MSQPSDDVNPEISAPADTPPRKTPPRDDSAVHIKDTIESILVAFILAFIFRCFVVEPFVIPTGSMAPTLLGAHTRHRCPECGFTFDVDYQINTTGNEEGDIPSYAGPVWVRDDQSRKMVLVNSEYNAIHCPNCGYLLPPQVNPPVHFGDRVVVLKYSELLEKLKRWDVVVFKTPDGSEEDHRFIWNYIKRLIGLPGESVMVLDGDIYVKSPGSDHFVVQTKTPEAQSVLWRILYNDDFRPSGAAPRDIPWAQPWQTTKGTGWTDHLPPGDQPGFGFDNASGSGTLAYHSTAGRSTNIKFRDYAAYDEAHSGHGFEGESTVSDLKLDLYYNRQSGDGPLRLSLSKLDDRFIAEILPTQILLHHEHNGREIGSPQSVVLTALPPGPHHFIFTNVDYRVTLQMDGEVLLQTTPQQYHPDIPQLIENLKSGLNTPLPEAQISAERQTCQLSHVSLWRDIYYTQSVVSGSNSMMVYGNPIKSHYGDTGPVELGPGEYFVMGDNSPMSSDARFWTEPVDLPNELLHCEGGRVPERFMLGRAFFVYWPAGFRPKGLPGIIPNFGEMRFIR